MSTATKTAPSDTTIETFFETKTTSDVAGTMALFSPDLVSYIDPTLGWECNGCDALKVVFEQYMPKPTMSSQETAVRQCRHAFASSRDGCATGSVRPRCHVRACLT